MQNVSSDSANNSEKIDKGNSLQELSKVSTPQFSSPIKLEFNSSYAEIQAGFLSDTSDSEEDDVSGIQTFVIEEDDFGNERLEPIESSEFPEQDELAAAQMVETHARLEALLEAAGIGKLASGDGKLADPEVLRRLTSSVSCALDEAAAALTRMRNENPRPQNERSLVQACSDGDVKTVKKLLTEGRSVHETTDDGESLLSLACSAGYYELAQVLLAMNANVEDRGIKGDCTPLMEAASAGFIEIVQLLINHGADVNGQSSSGNTPLMYACAGGHEAVVRVLVECGANVEDHNENGHTPLMEAASAGHVGVAKILLEYGAGINTHSNEFKESALTLACYKGHLDMVRFLLSAGADQEHKTDEMHTALMEASMDGHVEVAKLLLDSGAQVNMPTDSFESPLTLAACGGHVDLALLLIERGANIEEVNDEGYTPLMEAAREGHEEMVCVLLQKGAKINAHTDETQETALTLACCGGFLDVADFLLKHGADIELGASTPLMEAAQEGHLDLVKYLLDAGAQVHAKTQTGDTALTYACENGHTDVADLLLSYGANLHESEGGRTPLMKACRAGHLCTVQFLISKSADVNRQTSNNDHTPLSLACAGGHLNVVQLLLAHNADPYHKLKDNSTMLIEAAKGGHTNVVQLLLDYPQSVIGGTTPSSTDSSSHQCSQGGRDMRLSGLTDQQRDEIIRGIYVREEAKANMVAAAVAAANENPDSCSSTAADLREQLQSINLQQLRLLQKQKLQSQQLHTRQIDFLKFTDGQNSTGSTTSPSPTSDVEQKSNVSQKQATSSSTSSPLSKQNQPTKQSQPRVDHVDCSKTQPLNHQLPRPKETNSSELPKQSNSSSSNKLKVKHMSQARALITPAGSHPALTQSDYTVLEKKSVKGSGVVNQTFKGFKKARTTVTLSTKLDENIFSYNKQQKVPTKPVKEPLQQSSNSTKNESVQVNSGSHTPIMSLSPPSSPVTSPESENNTLRPITPPLPPLNFDAGNAARPSVSQGTNTTVLHNTVYTRSVPVPTPADVNQSTAICDRPKAKPVSKKEGKNLKKTLAAYHFAVQQQKEALQLKQLVEMNEQLVNQVVSQQKQLVLPQGNETNQEASMMHTPPISLLSSDILADSMARSKLLASTAKEVMESMNVQVDMDQETRNLIDQLETITMEEVERAANQGQKQLLQEKLDYAAGYLEGLKMATNNNNTSETPRVQQQVGVNFVQNGDGGEGTETMVQVVTGPDSYQYFTVPSPGSPAQVNQNNPYGLRLVPKEKILNHLTKSDSDDSSPFSSPTLPLQDDESDLSEPTATAAPNHPSITSPNSTAAVTATPSSSPTTTSTSANQIQVGTQTPSIESVSPGTIKKLVQQAVKTNVKKREVRPTVVTNSSSTSYSTTVTNNSASSNTCQTTSTSSAVSTDPNQPRFPSTTDTPSPSSVTTSASYTGMDVDSETESNHDTALTLACAGGHEELVELLLSRGADIEHRDKKGFTPLILAATAGHDKVVDILLNHAADMEAQSERTKDTPLSLACSGGRYEVVELLLKRGANKEHRNVSDYTPLSLAASGGYVNIIKLLLNHGAEINSRTGSKLGISPLMLAAMNGHTAAVKLLLDMGSDINAQIETNRNTALTLACFQGRHEVVSLLLDRKANVEHRAKTGLSPLMEAASGGYVEVGRVLLDKGADVNAPAVPSSRDTALTIAADKGHGRFVELLLSRGAQVEVKNKKGNSPLWLAANGGHQGVVELLCKHRADIDSQDNRKVSCLMAAFRKGHVKVVRWMVNHVAQFPSDQEMTRFIQTVNDKELLDKCQDCAMVIRVAKNQQAERANKNAVILLEELDMEKWREESKRAAQARKRERKKQKKQEKKEGKKKQNKEDPDDDQDDDDDEGEDKENMADDEDLNVSNGRDGEEGDSGIDANSQASCSSNEVKQQTSSKSKKKKKSASTSNVPAKVSNTTSSTSNTIVNKNSLQKNASSTAVNTAKQPTESSAKQSSESSNNTSKKDKKKSALNSQNSNSQPQQKTLTSSSSSNVKEPSSNNNNKENQTSNKETKGKNKSTQQQVVQEVSKVVTAAPPVLLTNVNNVISSNNNNNTKDINKDSKEKKTKERITTPRKEAQQQLVFESTRHPAEREDFTATGNEPSKDRKKTSLMSLYSDGELVASSAGGKINNTKQPPGSKREEGWKEVVRKYLNTTMKFKKVSVPLNAISRVIGRGGSNINAIRSATNAHIEVEKQCKGQGERIITIKGNGDAIKQANSLINALIKDPDVDIMKLLSETNKTAPTTPTMTVKSKAQLAPPLISSSISTSPISSLKQSVPLPVTAATPLPYHVGSAPINMTFVNKSSLSTRPSQMPLKPQVTSVPLMPGLRTSAPRSTAPRIAPAGDKRTGQPSVAPSSASTSNTQTTMSYTSAIMTKGQSSSFAAKLTEAPVVPTSSPPPQNRPPPTASAPPSISAPFQQPPTSSMSPTPGAHPNQMAPGGVTEYSLFNDPFKNAQWGREDGAEADKKGMNFASVAANNGTITPPNTSTTYLEPSPPADASKAPGYRGTSVASPIMSKTNYVMSSNAPSPSPAVYQQTMLPPADVVDNVHPQNVAMTRPRPTSMYSEEPLPMYQQDLLKMVPGVNGVNYIPTSVSMSRLNPRAPDFSIKAPQPLSQQSQTPIFNATVAPPTHIPPPAVSFPAQNKYQAQQVPPNTRWQYMNYPGNQPPQHIDMIAAGQTMDINQLASLAMAAQNQSGDMFNTMAENTPPTSPQGMDERKAPPPRPIGTERAWKNYTNVIGSGPIDESAWLQQETKCYGGIGDGRHVFRNAQAVPQYSRLPLPEDVVPQQVHLVENGYQNEPHYNLNGAAVMLMPTLETPFEVQQQQAPFGLTSLIPDAFNKPEWESARLCMSDVPLTDKQQQQQPQVWTKWTN